MLRVLNEEDIRKLFGGGSERSDLEFKPPFTWGIKLEQPDGNILNQEKVIRGIMGLSHHSLGGVIIIGIEERANHQPVIKGLGPRQLQSFQDTEAICATIDSFSAEKIYYEIGTGKFPNARNQKVDLIVITVEQFTHYATMCTKNGQTGQLRKGALYIRPAKGQPRTEEVTPPDFRELQDMATDNVQTSLENRGWMWNSTGGKEASRIADLEETGDE